MGGALTARCGLFGPAAGGVSYINSVQQVSITIATGATSGTATITSVDTSRTILIPQGQTCTVTTDTAANFNLARIELTNATTITAYRNTSSAADTVTVNCAVVECTSNLVSSVQYGTISISSATSATGTITSVNLTRSCVISLGGTTSGSNLPQSQPGVSLTNATTVTAFRGTSGTTVAGFVVVEFQAAAIQSVQQVTDSYASANTTNSKTISSVTQGNTVLFWGGQTSANSGITSGFNTLQLTSATNVDAVRIGTQTGAIVPYYTVVEFVAGVMASSAQRGTIDLSGTGETATATITSISTTKGFASCLGGRSSGGAAGRIQQRLTLTNATTITGTVQSTVSDTRAVAYEAVGFN